MRRLRHRRRQVYSEEGAGGLELSAIGDARITGKLGEGVSCVVYKAEWDGREVALKLYKAGSIERHARLHDQELARFEYERNLAFYEAPGMARYVARPYAYLSTAGISALIQEKLDGRLYYHRYQAGELTEAVFEHVRKIVELSHAAGLYDIDLHSGNMMVVESDDGELMPKLFDFNFIPFYIHPPNPGVAILLKLGLIDRRFRDLRKLKRFHDFTRFRRKIGILLHDLFGNIPGQDYQIIRAPFF